MPVLYIPVEPPPPPPPSYPSSSAGRPPQITWTAASGDVVPLSDPTQGYAVLHGLRGLNLPTYQIHQTDSALDGTVVRGTRTEARELYLPIYLEAPTWSAVLAKRRDLARRLHPAVVDGGGEGRLTLAEADGTRRHINAYYTGGMDGPDGGSNSGMYWATYGITLLAQQPYWERDPVTHRWAIAPPTDTWLPILPIKVRDADVIGEGMTITNPGSVRSWPVWTIRGPLDGSAVMRNVTTGQQLEFTATLSEGEQIVIDTRPRRKTVRDGTGANMFAALTVGSVLWPLAPGPNVVDVELTGLDDDSRLELEITPLELTA